MNKNKNKECINHSAERELKNDLIKLRKSNNLWNKNSSFLITGSNNNEAIENIKRSIVNDKGNTGIKEINAKEFDVSKFSLENNKSTRLEIMINAKLSKAIVLVVMLSIAIGLAFFLKDNRDVASSIIGIFIAIPVSLFVWLCDKAHGKEKIIYLIRGVEEIASDELSEILSLAILSNNIFIFTIDFGDDLNDELKKNKSLLNQHTIKEYSLNFEKDIFYSDIQKRLSLEIEELNQLKNKDFTNKRSAFLVLGEYGSGKTFLINRVKENLHQFCFKNIDVQKISAKNLDLSTTKYNSDLLIARRKRWTKIAKELMVVFLTMTAAALALLGTSKVDEKPNEAYAIISCVLVALSSCLFIITLTIFTVLSRQPKEKKGIYIVEDVDRFNWEYILKMFAHSYSDNNIFIFTLSINNLDERYREEYSFYPRALMLAFEKYVYKQYDLSEYYEESKNIILRKKGLILNPDIILPYNNFRFLNSAIQDVSKIEFKYIENSFSDDSLKKIKESFVLVQYIKMLGNDVFQNIKREFTSKLLIERENDKEWFEMIEFQKLQEINRALSDSFKTDYTITNSPKWANGYEELIFQLADHIKNYSKGEFKSNMAWSAEHMAIPLQAYFMDSDSVNMIFKLFSSGNYQDIMNNQILSKKTKAMISLSNFENHSIIDRIDLFKRLPSNGIIMNHDALLSFIKDAKELNDTRWEDLSSLVNTLIDNYLYNSKVDSTNFTYIWNVIKSLSDDKWLKRTFIKGLNDEEMKKKYEIQDEIKSIIETMLNKKTSDGSHVNWFSHEKYIINKNKPSNIMEKLVKDNNSIFFLHKHLYELKIHDKKIKVTGEFDRVVDENDEFIRKRINALNALKGSLTLQVYKDELSEIKIEEPEYNNKPEE